jgi:nicotinamidase-related amidase
MCSKLRDDPIPPSAIHLCVDMQLLYAGDTDWALPWMPRVLPRVVRLCEAVAARTVFTRFVPAERPGQGRGTWRRYYRRWASMTLQEIGRDRVRLVPELAGFAPPATVVDKPVYSPWLGSDLHARLRAGACDTLVVTGGETDMCVLATVLGAVDLGYRTVIGRDAICSSSDATHDAMLTLFHTRFGEQVEIATVAEILDLWRPARLRRLAG